jgi:peptidoglycan/LPS O-acetylase OafA/YrhL
MANFNVRTSGMREARMKEIKALTSLRGIAAMLVVMQHFSTTAERHATGPIPSLVPHGYMAVDLFFVLSGFIMAYTYRADFALRGNLAMPSFLLKRAARILPLNTVVVITIVLARILSSLVLGSNIFYGSTNLAYDTTCNLLLLQGLGVGLNLNGPPGR